MDNISLLRKKYNLDNKNEIFFLQNIRENNIEGIVKGLWSVNETFALHSFFIDKKVEQAKQHYYVCGKLDEYLIKNHDTILWPYRMCNALLSDNKTIIDSYAHIKNSRYAYDATRDGVNFQAMQNIIKNDTSILAQNIEIVDKFSNKKKGWRSKFYGLCKLYYESILENDKTQIEDAIAQLVEPKFQKKRKSSEINLIDAFGASFAKLAWLRGIEVEIDSPLIPKELLPINPNKTYTMPYDFLK